jgi:hypothetical protein
MKKVSILLGGLIGGLVFIGCSKGDCVCVSTTTVNGVVTNTSSSSSSLDSGIPGPLGAAFDSAGQEDCDNGDYYYSNTNYQGESEESRTECDFE